MVHLIAVLLILFPGFGAGYLLLGRFRQFAIHFLFSAFLGTFITIALIFGSPPFVAGMVFVIAPMLVWNVYHAHRLWLEVPAGHSDSKAEQVRFSYTLAPLAAAVILALGLILGIMAVPLMFSDEQPKSDKEMRREEVEERLDKHDLVYKARLYNKVARRHYYWYDVEPGGYTLEIYFIAKGLFREIGLPARTIRRSTDNLVYVEGFEVYVLNTKDRNALERLIADLREHRPDDCIDGEVYGECGYEPR